MMLGRGPLGKLVMVVFILFNIVMLGLAVLAHNFKAIPLDEIRAEVMAEAIAFGKETRDDRRLDAKEMENIEQMVTNIMELIEFVQQKGLDGLLILWAIGVGILGVLVYFTRPQPI